MIGHENPEIDPEGTTGTTLLVFLTTYSALLPTSTSSSSLAMSTELGPLLGGFSNFLLLTLFTFAFGVVTGAHLNPTITLATFCARLSTLPRMLLYLTAQLAGGAIGGLLVRAALEGSDAHAFHVAGCFLTPAPAGPPVRAAFAVEFMAATGLLFLAFGVGLDPRQQKIIPPSLSPFLVGLTLGTLSWVTASGREGFGGAGLNPARCLGAYVAGGTHAWWGWQL